MPYNGWEFNSLPIIPYDGPLMITEWTENIPIVIIVLSLTIWSAPVLHLGIDIIFV